MTRRLVVALAASAVLMSGCGDSRLSSNQLIAHATTICSQANRVTGRIQAPSSPNGAEAFLARGVPALTRELARLRTLHPPEDAEGVYGTAIESFSHKLEALESAVHGLKHGDSPVNAMSSLSQKLAPIEAAENGAWQALQIPSCLNR